MTKKKLGRFALAAATLAATATTSIAQDDILSRYRAQGGMLPVDAGVPPAGTNGNGAGSSSEGPARAMVDLLADGTEASQDKIDGFNEAIDQAFPMTPEMIRRYREILRKNEVAAQEQPEPTEETATTLVSLEPGEAAPLLQVSPSIASVIGFYDATGAAWPITEYVLGNNEKFRVTHLGNDSNNLVMSPQANLGFTNLVVLLQGYEKPVTVRVNISEDVAHYRYDLQVMQIGPNAEMNNASTGLTKTVKEAGSSSLLAALTGVDLPRTAREVDVVGVNARGWIIGEDLFLRSRHAMLSPTWMESMSGPDGVRVYKINPASVALFSVNGQIVRADIKLP